MSEEIGFSEVPADLLVPGVYIEVNNKLARTGGAVLPHQAILIGQRLAAGTVAKEIVTEILDDGASAEGYFGTGSMLAQMVRAFRSVNRKTKLFAVALDDDAAGTAATGKIAFGAALTATENKTMIVKIGGWPVRVAIASGDDQDAVAAAVVAAINAEKRLPLTAAVNGVNAYEVDLTCRWKGTTGNDIPVSVENRPAGITAPVITAMNGGATDPALSLAIAALGNEQYHTVVQPFVDATSLASLEAHLLAKFGAMEQKEGHAYCADYGTQAQHLTLGATRNSQFNTIFGLAESVSLTWEIAAQMAGGITAKMEIHPRYVNAPREGIVLPWMVAPAREKRLDPTERDQLLKSGISTYTVSDFGVCMLDRVVTTYQKDEQSTPDRSYLDEPTMRLLAAWRYRRRVRTRQAAAGMKLAADDNPKVQGVMTAHDIRDEHIAQSVEEFIPWGWQEGGAAFDRFVETMVYQRDYDPVAKTGDPARVNYREQPDFVNILGPIAGQIQFLP